MFNWSHVWLGWLIAVFVSFGVLEGIALSINAKDTLSDTTWKWFHVIPGQGIQYWTLPHILAVIVLITIAIVLILHLGLGLFR